MIFLSIENFTFIVLVAVAVSDARYCIQSMNIPSRILVFTLPHNTDAPNIGVCSPLQGVAINFVKEDDVRTLRDIEQFYGTVT